MQSNPLLLIEDFSETIAAIFKSFSQICKAHAEKMKEARPQFARLEEQIRQERKRRMELETLVANKMKGKSGEKGNDAPTTLKRPKNGFQLYMLEQQSSILREHPSLDPQKVATFVSYKWKHLKKQYQLAYEKRAQDMNKISDDELQTSLKMNANNDAVYIKKEYNEEGQEHQIANLGESKENLEPYSENNDENERIMDSSMQESHVRDNNFEDGSREEQLRMNEQGQQQPPVGAGENMNGSIQNTMMMEQEQGNQPTIRMEEQPPIQNTPEQVNKEEQDENEQ